MKLETQRLTLFPLDFSSLQLLIRDMRAFEEKFSLKYKAASLSGEYLEALNAQLARIALDPSDFLWYTFWLVLKKTDNTVIASACFMSPPDSNGESEIGYGISPEFGGQGYMTEAVMKMCEWAQDDVRLKALTAKTEKDNLPSQNILKRCSFVLCKAEEEELLLWKRQKPLLHERYMD